MEKRIQVIDGTIVISTLIVLTASEFNTLENEKARKRIDSIAKDLNVQWAVETGGNISTCAISRPYGVVVGHNEMHEMELVADKFMQAIREIKQLLTKEKEKEPECPAQENADDEGIKDVEFVKRMLHDMNLPRSNKRSIMGAIIVDTSTSPLLPDITCWGHMSYGLLREMCEIYLEAHYEFKEDK